MPKTGIQYVCSNIWHIVIVVLSFTHDWEDQSYIKGLFRCRAQRWWCAVIRSESSETCSAIQRSLLTGGVPWLLKKMKQRKQNRQSHSHCQALPKKVLGDALPNQHAASRIRHSFCHGGMSDTLSGWLPCECSGELLQRHWRILFPPSPLPFW